MGARDWGRVEMFNKRKIRGKSKKEYSEKVIHVFSELKLSRKIENDTFDSKTKIVKISD